MLSAERRVLWSPFRLRAGQLGRPKFCCHRRSLRRTARRVWRIRGLQAPRPALAGSDPPAPLEESDHGEGEANCVANDAGDNCR